MFIDLFKPVVSDHQLVVWSTTIYHTYEQFEIIYVTSPSILPVGHCSNCLFAEVVAFISELADPSYGPHEDAESEWGRWVNRLAFHDE